MAKYSTIFFDWGGVILARNPGQIIKDIQGYLEG